MPDIRPNFSVLEDPSSPNAGLPWHRMLEGETLAAKNAGAVAAFKNAAGEMRYPEVDENDILRVNTENESIVDLHDHGEDTAGSASYVDLATITLQNSMKYKKIGFAVSCFRDSVFQIYWVDDVAGAATETILATIRLGAGDNADQNELPFSFTSGGTGTQELRVRALNLNALSTLDGAISSQEVQ